MPKVGVIIPCYNCEKYLSMAIESVLAQTFQDFEIITVNDGSTDSTLSIMKRYEPRVTIISQTNSGISAARNAGIAHTNAKYIALLDSDDLWYPEKLEKQVSLMDEDENAIICHTNCEFIDKEGLPLPEIRSFFYKVQGFEDGLRRMIVRDFIAVPSVMIRVSLLKSKVLFNSSYLFAEDWECWIRLAQLGRIISIPEVLSRYRFHDKSHSGDLEKVFLSEISIYQNLVFKHQAELLENVTDKKAMQLAIADARKECADLYSDLGKLYMKKKDRRSARKYYFNAFGLSPFQPKLWLRWARSFIGL